METHSPFDTYAPSYDVHFEDNPITAVNRATIQQTMLQFFQPGNTILELNCGTGTDALFLAKNGMNILATDASQGMIEKAKEKISKANLSDKITLRQITLENISELSGETYNGVLSNFGGLNCVYNLPDAVKNIAGLLQPNGIFILTIMNKFYLWETLSFITRLHFPSAFRRLKKQGVYANVDGNSVYVQYYFAHDVIRMFSPWFTSIEHYGINFLSPSPNSLKFYYKHPHLCDTLIRLEHDRRYTYPLYNLSDHVVLVFKKR